MSASADASSPQLSVNDVRKVATLARLALDDAQIESSRRQLAGVLALVDRLRELDLSDVEPMTHPESRVNRLDPDEPSAEHARTRLSPADLARIAPAMDGPFIVIPKVIGEEGGA